MVELIGATTTKTGLKVESALDTRSYQKGIKVSKAAMNARHHGDSSRMELHNQARQENVAAGRSKRLLDRSRSPDEAGQDAVRLSQRTAVLRPGTILAREWNGQMQRVAVRADGFAWNGNTYPSLSKVAFAVTGTRWNGPKFFGLRDKPAKASSP